MFTFNYTWSNVTVNINQDATAINITVMLSGKCRVLVSVINKTSIFLATFVMRGSNFFCYERINFFSYAVNIHLPRNNFMHPFSLRYFKTSKLHLKLIFLFFEIFSRDAFLQFSETLSIIFASVLIFFSALF